MLHIFTAVTRLTHRLWNRLSGVRFSWTITTMCLKLEICAFAGESARDRTTGTNKAGVFFIADLSLGTPRGFGSCRCASPKAVLFHGNRGRYEIQGPAKTSERLSTQGPESASVTSRG